MREALARSPAEGSFRAAAAALAAAPIGFASGAILSVRQLAPREAGGDAGAMVLGYGLLGALIAAVLFALVAFRLPPKPARIATLVAGGASFAILLYMVGDFVADRMARAQAFDAAYAAMPAFELALASNNPGRRPFSKLAYDAETREYTATRPGGWLCRGTASRQHKMALFAGLRVAEASDDCERKATWRIDGGSAKVNVCGAFDSLFAAADEMVEATQRHASCRRPDD